ncbi:MAG: hypothetical protein SGJ07_11030 [Rhodospirillaceae bacterium]|nr:hypothetical protein [Rhodospirillaceae bacterium]
MLSEYAVEPQAIGSSWETFRYVIEKFGFDRGRLISQFPKHWFRDVYDATAGLPPMQKKRVEEALSQARKNKVVRSQRPYDGEAGNWLHNAVTEQQRSPFRAIIASQNPNGEDFILLPGDLDETHPLLAVEHDCPVARDAHSIAAAMKEFLQFGSRIVFVDAFYSPYRAEYKSTFRECLALVKALNPNAVCEIHYRYHDDKPSNVELEREAANLFPGVIPDGMKVTIYCWRQKPGGEDFHARYLLTEKGGIRIDAGFSADGAQETTDVQLMGFALSQQRLAAFTRGAPDYDLVEPVIRVAADGSVERQK